MRPLQPALQPDGIHQRFDPTRLVLMGVHTAGAGHQRRMHQGLQRHGQSPTERSPQTIPGQPPAGIERHAEAVHGSAPEQCFKAHLGGDHIHRLGLLQQPGGMQAVGADPDAWMLQILSPEMAPGPAPDHIRMHLHHHQAVRVVPQGLLQHPAETLRRGQPEADRTIAGGLVHHQHKRLLRNR